MKLGCSSFSWQSKDGKHLLGRTCDIDNLENSDLYFLPRNSQLMQNGKGETFVSKNALIGYSIVNQTAPIYIDGINEQGLAGCLLYYPKFACYNDYQEGKVNVDPIFFLTYALTTYNNLDDLCTSLQNINLLTNSVAGNAPVHFIFSDKTGETVIVEPDKDGLSVHRNTIGVMTNSPNYEWHKQNLRTYIGMQAPARQYQQIANFTVKPFGEGSGLIGLPGDYTPPSRFVRVAYLRELIDTPANEELAVSEMLNIFASVNIPLGLHIANNGKREGTLFTSIMGNDSLTYYISTRTNHRLSAVDLNKIKDNVDPIRFSLASTEEINWL